MMEREILLYHTLRGLHLLEKAPTDRVLRDLMGLQAQFANYPKMSLQLRASDYTEEHWDDNLYKIWSHRGTMHLIPKEELGLHLAAADNLAPYHDGMWMMKAKDMNRWDPFIVEQVRGGNTTRDGLKAACVTAGIDDYVLSRVFYGWGGLIGEMVMRGHIVCCTGTAKEYRIPEPFTIPERDAARMEFLKRYFRSFGPATREDCTYFFGDRKKPELNPLLDMLLPALNSLEFEGKTYYYEGDLVTDGAIPKVVLIPGFDQMILGYRFRDRMIDKQHLGKLTNISGIIRPSILLHGRIRAAWKKENDRVTVEPYEKLRKSDLHDIEVQLHKSFGRKTEMILKNTFTE